MLMKKTLGVLGDLVVQFAFSSGVDGFHFYHFYSIVLS